MEPLSHECGSSKAYTFAFTPMQPAPTCPWKDLTRLKVCPPQVA